MIKDSLRRISFHYTFKCTIECPHCITVSSPRRHEKVDFEVAKKSLREAIDLDFGQLSFTGGEALIYKREALTLARMASEAGMKVLFMSNGFWAKTARSAEKMAAELAGAGVTHVCISTDKYHLRAGLPFEVVVNGLHALRPHGIKVKVQYAREVEDPELEIFQALLEPEDLVVDVFPVYSFGRAAKFERAILMSDEEANDSLCPFGPLVMPDGAVVKCCGGSLVSERAHDDHPALLGDVYKESFHDIVVRARSGEDVLLTGFCTWGSKKLGKLLKPDFWETEEKAPYQGMCDLCCRLLNDPERVAALRAIVEKPEIASKIRRQAQLLDAMDKNRDDRWESEWEPMQPSESRREPRRSAAAEAEDGSGHLDFGASSTQHGRGVRVGIADTGISAHPRVGEVSGGVALSLGPDDDVLRGEEWADAHGHGTACAGIIRRLASEAELYALRISDEEALSSARLIAAAIDWAIEHELHILNASLGTIGERFLPELRAACARARNAGLVVVAAESNEGLRVYPAELADTVAVGGAKTEGLYHFYRDPRHPGRYLGNDARQRVAWLDGGHRFLGGTSMAAAQISGLLASVIDPSAGCSASERVAALDRYAEAQTSLALEVGGGAPDQPLAKGLADAPPAMKRVVLYPFAKELHALVRFRELLPFEIVSVADPLGGGSVGKDAGEVIGIGRADIPVTPRAADMLAEADGFVIGHLGSLGRIRRTDLLSEMLEQALAARTQVYSLDPLEPHALLVERAAERGLDWRWPRFDASPELLTDAAARVNETCEKPVIGVFGTRSGQGKFTAQLALRRELEASGYRVGHLSTEPHAALFGADAVFPMGYNARVPLELGHWIPYLRQQMAAIAAHRDPEIILVGSQSGTIPRDPHLRFEYLCLNTQLFLYGTRPDAVMLVVHAVADDAEARYIDDTIAALRILGKTEVIALMYSDRLVEPGESRRTRKARSMTDDERATVRERLEQRFGLQALCISDRDDQRRGRERIVEFFRSGHAAPA